MEQESIIRFRCECGKKLKADTSIIGRRVKCAKCDKVNVVPPKSTATPRKRNAKVNANDAALQPNKPADSSSDSNASSASKKFKGNPSPAKPKPTKRKSVAPPSKQKTVPSGKNLLADDSSENDDVSLLPKPSDRFKQPPELDPAPKEELIDGSDSFDFDPALIDYSSASPSPKPSDQVSLIPESSPNAEQTSTTPKPRNSGDDLNIDTDFEPRFKVKQDSKLKPILIYGGGAVIGLLALAGMIYGVMLLIGSGGTQYPETFESLNEVKQYRTASIKYEKSRRQFRVMGEAYVKSNETTESEEDDFQSFLDSTERDHSDVLKNAFAMIEEDQASEAKNKLVEASQELNKTRLKIDARASAFQKKL